jgi:hypothetical protein
MFAGVLVAALRMLLFAAIFALVIAVAVIVSSFLMALIALRQARPSAEVRAESESAVP